MKLFLKAKITKKIIFSVFWIFSFQKHLFVFQLYQNGPAFICTRIRMYKSSVNLCKHSQIIYMGASLIIEQNDFSTLSTWSVTYGISLM